MLKAAFTLGLVAAALSAPAALAAAGDVELVSISSNGELGDDDSTAPSISRDGNAIAFQSRAGNLVGSDGNGGLDVFVRRRGAHSTARVSGGPGVSAGATDPAISADGGTVAFESFAPELGAGQFGDIFVHRGGQITRITHETGNGSDVGGYDPTVSGDGQVVVFQSSSQQLIPGDDNGLSDIFSSRGGSITRLSESSGGGESNGFSDEPALSADGRFVAFVSEATNLTTDADTVASWDIFVRALAGGTERVTHGLGGAQPNGQSEEPAISGNGDVVAFRSFASNLVAGDGNGVSDIFVYDRNANRTERVSVASDGAEGSAHAVQPSISADGRYVAFAAGDTNLTPGDTNNTIDIFVHDRQTGETRRVSRRPGSPFGAGDDAFAPSISGDGCFVAFQLEGGGGLVPADLNGQGDIYVVDLGCSGGAPPAGPSDPSGGDPVGPPSGGGGDPVGPPHGDPVGPPAGAVAAPVRGTVRVRTPGAKRFRTLRAGAPLPRGAEIDTRRGVLRLTVGGASGLVSKGRARVTGATLTLTGRKLLVRALTGRFRTRAKGAAATGAHATWLTVVRRRGVTVRSGGKTVRLRRGDRYRVRSSQSRTTPQ